jgi:putative zinc finger protein
MSGCERYQEDLTLLAWGDLSPQAAAAVEAHLSECGACFREREALSRVVAALAPRTALAREAEIDWERFAAETVARVERESPSKIVTFRRRARLGFRPALVLKAAGVVLAAGLVTVAILKLPAGQRPAAGSREGTEPVATLVSAEFQQRVEMSLARQGTQRYLEQSRAVLINVLDAPVRCAKNQIDISAERQRSIELLRSKQLLQDALERPELERAAQLCDQLEGVLTEISTLKDCADLERIRDLRAAVQRNQLLVKIRVAEQELGGGLA